MRQDAISLSTDSQEASGTQICICLARTFTNDMQKNRSALSTLKLIELISRNALEIYSCIECIIQPLMDSITYTTYTEKSFWIKL